MKRLDLIIDALDRYLIYADCILADADEGIAREALAAARELRELEPVAWTWKDGTITTDPDYADGMWTKLYALGESNES